MMKNVRNCKSGLRHNAPSTHLEPVIQPKLCQGNMPSDYYQQLTDRFSFSEHMKRSLQQRGPLHRIELQIRPTCRHKHQGRHLHAFLYMEHSSKLVLGFWIRVWNVDLHRDTPDTTSLTAFFRAHGFHQHVKVATTPQGSFLNHVESTSPCTTDMHPTYWSDHIATLAYLPYTIH